MRRLKRPKFGDQGGGGSNPLSPTKFFKQINSIFGLPDHSAVVDFVVGQSHSSNAGDPAVLLSSGTSTGPGGSVCATSELTRLTADQRDVF